MRPQLSIATFFDSAVLAQSLMAFLISDRYVVTHLTSAREFSNFVENRKEQLDCLIVQDDPQFWPVVKKLREQATLLPSVIVKVALEGISKIEPTQKNQTITNKLDFLDGGNLNCIYHPAEVRVSIDQLSQIPIIIDQAIAKFLTMSPTPQLTAQTSTVVAGTNDQNSLMWQQRRLAEKLRERLGYLGVYYKRNPQQFLRNLPSGERQEFLETLKSEYRKIVLNYFSPKTPLNQQIDEFVNMVFFADVAVTQIVEIHMELMDEFAKHLQLEGRSEEVLLDYRLTLIDTLAHLCEMYRRSIPRDS